MSDEDPQLEKVIQFGEEKRKGKGKHIFLVTTTTFPRRRKARICCITFLFMSSGPGTYGGSVLGYMASGSGGGLAGVGTLDHQSSPPLFLS